MPKTALFQYSSNPFSQSVMATICQHPFGMLIKERSYTSDSYRFGFNSQEKDDEINGDGNSYAFEYRIHDPRLGRFLSVDPLYGVYPWNSTYSFAENKLGLGIEFEGLELSLFEGQLENNGKKVGLTKAEYTTLRKNEGKGALIMLSPGIIYFAGPYAPQLFKGLAAYEIGNVIGYTHMAENADKRGDENGAAIYREKANNSVVSASLDLIGERLMIKSLELFAEPIYKVGSHLITSGRKLWGGSTIKLSNRTTTVIGKTKDIEVIQDMGKHVKNGPNNGGFKY